MILNLVRISAVVGIAAAIAIVTSDANAATVGLRWDRPLYREDCSPLQANEISKYEIEWEHVVTGKKGTKFPKADLTGYALYVPLAGRYKFRIRAHDTGGRISGWDRVITADVYADGRVSPLEATPSVNHCTPQILPVCPYLCRAQIP